MQATIIVNSAEQPFLPLPSTENRVDFLRKVYLILVIQTSLIPTMAGIVWMIGFDMKSVVSYYPLIIAAVALLLVSVIVLGCCFCFSDDNVVSYVFLATYSICQGFLLGVGSSLSGSSVAMYPTILIPFVTIGIDASFYLKKSEKFKHTFLLMTAGFIFVSALIAVIDMGKFKSLKIIIGMHFIIGLIMILNTTQIMEEIQYNLEKRHPISIAVNIWLRTIFFLFITWVWILCCRRVPKRC
jgi:hypothetical protein